MNKEAYLKKLKGKLKKLPMEEVDAALDYYREYFEEAGEENTEQVIRKLGSPSQVASQILADYAVKGIESNPNSTKKGISAIWFILLAILAAPIALPLLITVFSLVFALVLVCGSFFFALFTIAAALTLSGIVSIVAGLFVLTQHWQTSIFFIGLGLIATGIGIVLFPPLVRITKSASIGLAKWLKKLFDKMTRRRKEEM